MDLDNFDSINNNVYISKKNYNDSHIVHFVRKANTVEKILETLKNILITQINETDNPLYTAVQNLHPTVKTDILRNNSRSIQSYSDTIFIQSYDQNKIIASSALVKNEGLLGVINDLNEFNIFTRKEYVLESQNIDFLGENLPEDKIFSSYNNARLTTSLNDLFDDIDNTDITIGKIDCEIILSKIIGELPKYSDDNIICSKKMNKGKINISTKYKFNFLYNN